jgi:hypothetical protein
MAKANTCVKRRPCDAIGNLHEFLARDNTVRRHAKKSQKLNGAGPIAPKDADATKENISGICRKFNKWGPKLPIHLCLSWIDPMLDSVSLEVSKIGELL